MLVAVSLPSLPPSPRGRLLCVSVCSGVTLLAVIAYRTRQDAPFRDTGWKVCNISYSCIGKYNYLKLKICGCFFFFFELAEAERLREEESKGLSI